ncbi:P-loop containing nucleoside triphosphate hydrolase protein [Caulochytrium protostelioides]|uniref:P-loop containing nucleoside triphosphate hydrolase protein n=1 Tax=Caulochytrium protostelioides TaxID=1555241 RepID=A0A4P9WZ35_9FUNG|nr:P-loop containing nucleoside triphosphate hydrolase protein [Caulochytrium protostelioides]
MTTGLSVHDELVGITTIQQVLELGEEALSQKTRLVLPRAQEVVAESARCLSRAGVTVRHLLTQQRALHIVLPDRACAQAFPSLYTGTVHEIYGESGSGKTQMCLQLALLVQLDPELGGLAKGRMYQLPSFAARGRLGLIVIDSMAGCFRGPPVSDDVLGGAPPAHGPDGGSAVPALDYAQRGHDMNTVVTRLRALADDHGLVVVLTNQVTARPGAGGTARGSGGDGGHLEPALGLAFSTLIGTRIHLSKAPSAGDLDAQHDAAASDSGWRRQLAITFSSVHPTMSVPFRITAEGVVPASS